MANTVITDNTSRRDLRHHSGRLQSALQLLCALSLALGALAGAAHAQSGAPVGEVSLVLGEATRHAADGEFSKLARGMTISVNDRIETRSNGHVHIRFVDNALVSVRPNSRLTIDRYEYDSNRPELSSVKFELLEGVTRAISGDAAKAARDRFRLNTPIAAIGVRGTDFVVSADSGTTRALVNEGAIVMAPLSEACSVDALGPCLTNALELTGDSLQLASVEGSEPLPRLLPPQNIRNPDMMQEEVRLAVASVNPDIGTAPSQEAPRVIAAAAPETSAEQTVNNQVLIEGAAPPAVASAEVAAAASVQPIAPDPEEPVQPPTPEEPVAPVVPDFTPEVALTLADLGERQLVWGHYAANPLLTDKIVLPYPEAKQGRSVSVGSAEYGLFRADHPDGGRRLDRDLGIVGFQLSSAQAVYNSQTGIVAMAVNDGSLSINFQENSFSTALTLNSDATGQIDFAASGRVVDGGLLRAIEETQRVTGAVSYDGTEAGYKFERQLENGTVSGLTLWNSD